MSNLNSEGKSVCFLWICRVPEEHEISTVSYQCVHLKSMPYCTFHAPQLVLTKETLTEMVTTIPLGEDKKQLCLVPQKLAKDNKLPLSVYTKVGTAQCVLIYEPTLPCYSRLDSHGVVWHKNQYMALSLIKDNNHAHTNILHSYLRKIVNSLEKYGVLTRWNYRAEQERQLW